MNTGLPTTFWRIFNVQGDPPPPPTPRERLADWWRRGEETRIAIGLGLSLWIAFRGFL